MSEPVLKGAMHVFEDELERLSLDIAHDVGGAVRALDNSIERNKPFVETEIVCELHGRVTATVEDALNEFHCRRASAIREFRSAIAKSPSASL